MVSVRARYTDERFFRRVRATGEALGLWCYLGLALAVPGEFFMGVASGATQAADKAQPHSDALNSEHGPWSHIQ